MCVYMLYILSNFYIISDPITVCVHARENSLLVHVIHNNNNK